MNVRLSPVASPVAGSDLVMNGVPEMWIRSLIVLAMSLYGCAGIHFRAATTPSTNGIRYYRPLSYILIKPDYAKKAPSITVKSLPDTSRPYAADPYAVIATNASTMEFTGGILTKVTTDSDGTKVATTAVNTAATVGAKLIENAAESRQVALALAKAGAAASRGSASAGEPPVFLFVATDDGVQQLYPIVGATNDK